MIAISFKQAIAFKLDLIELYCFVLMVDNLLLVFISFSLAVVCFWQWAVKCHSECVCWRSVPEGDVRVCMCMHVFDC